MDHILPQSFGGSDDVENLALACHRCNERHYNFTTATDPETKETVSLFNPRQQQWADHFIWTVEGLKIVGITPIGRAMCIRLDLNDESHDQGAIKDAGWFWVQGGWHPPADDPPRTNLSCYSTLDQRLIGSLTSLDLWATCFCLKSLKIARKSY